MRPERAAPQGKERWPPGTSAPAGLEGSRAGREEGSRPPAAGSGQDGWAPSRQDGCRAANLPEISQKAGFKRGLSSNTSRCSSSLHGAAQRWERACERSL